ncbi:MAG: AAA family ATPase [Chloroflexi bacterium]|nr:AAA family ATPase [Chloroflexota bacterium]
MAIKRLEVPVDQLRKVCDPKKLGFKTTDDIVPLEDTIGQERAISALELALGIDSPGFNLFVAGPAGSGRNSALKKRLNKIGFTRRPPNDWGYVHNFQDPAQPKAISLPCGLLVEFGKDMENLVTECSQEIPKAFESDDYAHRLEETMKGIEARRQELTKKMEQDSLAEGFVITSGQAGITPVPVKDGRAITQEEYAALTEDQQEALRKGAENIQHIVNHFMSDIRRLGKEANEAKAKVDTEIVRFTLSPIVNELQEKYKKFPDIVNYLEHVEGDILQNSVVFKPAEEQASPFPMPQVGRGDEDVFLKYRLNTFLDNTLCKGAPVIFENNPTYYNLFGRIEYKANFGAMATDLTMVKPGALHRANGGYLVVQARDLLGTPLSWETLKRTLRSGEIRIENIGEQLSSIPSATLRPEAIPFNAKIVIVGSPRIMRLLEVHDEDFQRLFKVTADFEATMKRTPANLKRYASFVADQSKEKGLRPFDASGVARIIDYSSRLVQHQDKLTTQFLEISDVLTEANHWAGKAKSKVVKSEHVKKALDQRLYRISLIEERMQEVIDDGTIHISTKGKVVGQVNGLAVLSDGNHTFGKPSKITAKVSLGKGQMVNVERETRLSGRIHDKGFLILQGYLQGKYGQDKPLSLTASIGFEQTYSEIDGDSASSTELYALLSEISGLPIEQGIAVTGSVNQSGDVQAIGGALHKVEGFFDVCKAKGLTGKQGVMLPKDNVKNLVLNDEVVEAVQKGKFHIWAVSNIDEGIEVLTGVVAGKQRKDGTYPKQSVHSLVEQRLREMAQKVKDYEKSLSKKSDDKKKKKGPKKKK